MNFSLFKQNGASKPSMLDLFAEIKSRLTRPDASFGEASFGPVWNFRGTQAELVTRLSQARIVFNEGHDKKGSPCVFISDNRFRTLTETDDGLLISRPLIVFALPAHTPNRKTNWFMRLVMRAAKRSP